MDDVISSSQLSNYPSLVGKNVNDFSFTKEMINAVNNFDFKRTAYNTLSGNYNTTESYIWTALSNITETTLSTSFLHENISEQFESDILNFIDNIANVDTCKIQALQSMINQLGISYSIFDKLHNLPLKILKLLDVLSIKKEYLISDKSVKKLFAQLLNEQISSDADINKDLLISTISGIVEVRTSSAEISAKDRYGVEVTPISAILSDALSVDYMPYIDSDKLYNVTSAIYAKVLSNYCYLTYNNPVVNRTDRSTDYIVNSLSDSIILSDFTIENTNVDDLNNIKSYRLKYNVSQDFNQSIELDKIEDGYKSYSDYNIHEQYLLSLEQSYRNQALSSKALYSRYYYYRQKAVQEYFKFIENEYSQYISAYLSTVQYPVNTKYLDITNIKKQALYRDINSQYQIDNSMIDNVANLLAMITKSIQDIREQIKTQVQKNFMKGTKTHLSYIIREYVKNNIYPVYKQLCQTLNKEDSKISAETYQLSDVIININEYTDSIEYFNISTDKDLPTEANINERFWETTHYINNIKPHNNTNIFSKSDIIKGSSKVNLTFDDVYNMYNQTLQMPLELSVELSANDYINQYRSKLSAFLGNVYNTGADNSYADESGNICCSLDFPETTSVISNYTSSDLEDFRDYKNRLFTKYSGLSQGSESFFNLKNKKHPSYQIHPYIQNFEYIDEAIYPINNIANIMSEKLTDLLYNSLSDYIDNTGYLQNVWNNPFNTNQDYITEYEKSTNITDLNTVKAYVDYDGLFYPDTIKLLLENIGVFCNHIKDNTNEFYKDISLNQIEREEIANQLTKFADNIITYVATDCRWSIYRYGKDYYGNAYILVKYDPNISSITQYSKKLDEDFHKNDLGVMFMKKKNHPLALPMMIYEKSDSGYTYNEDLSQIKIINDKEQQIYSNTDFLSSNLINTGFDKTNYYTVGVRDFCISKDKTQLMFVTDGNLSANDATRVLHANIKKIYDNNINQQKYNFYLTKDITSSRIINNKSDSTTFIPLVSSYQFIDFYNYNNNLGIVALATSPMSKLSATDYVRSCNIYMPYWDRDDKYGNQIKTQFNYTISCEDYLSDDNNIPKVSVNDKKQQITLAYINNKFENSISLNDELGHHFENYPNLSPQTSSDNTIDTLADSITTKELVYNSKAIFERADQQRQYAIYGNMGFVKAYLNTDNNLYDNGWLSSLALKQQIKIELCGPNKLSSYNEKSKIADIGIRYKFVIPARMHESYDTELFNNVFDNTLSIGNYNDVRYNESIENDKFHTINDPIYDPIQFTSEFGTQFNTQNLTTRIDENFAKRLNDVTTWTTNISSELSDYPILGKDTFDRFGDIPYILQFKFNDDITKYPYLYYPGSKEAEKYNVSLSNTYIIGIYDNKEDISDYLSVQWMYNTENSIKLDFNANWYNYNKNIHSFDIDDNVKNYFNIKHQFLNLDKPGSSGYLWLQSKNNSNQLLPTHVYYIKNISDEHPKFILQLVDLDLNADIIEDIAKYIPIADDALAGNVDDEGDTITKYDGDIIQVNIGDQTLYLDDYINNN